MNGIQIALSPTDLEGEATFAHQAADGIQRITNTCALLKTFCSSRQSVNGRQLRSVLELIDGELEFLDEELRRIVGFYDRLEPRPVPADGTSGRKIQLVQ
jgi:hypothetical protein